MKFVEIYKLKSDGSQQVIATCSLVNDRAICEGDLVFVDNLAIEGIPGIEIGSNLMPKDGLRFLEGLKFAFKSGYLNASDILEKAV